MKKIILLAILLLCNTYIFAQLKSRVDERFELTSIAFRLAGAEEYISNQIPEYTNGIDKYFARYTKHELISYIREIRSEYKIGYDAIPTATGCLIIENGKVLIGPEFNVATISRIDNRWSEETFKRFVELLDDFYRKSKFRRFYQQHASLYHLAEERMDELLRNVDADWFSTVFGEELGDPFILISLCNGRSNYAITMRGKEERKGILIGCGTDGEGMPLYGKDLLTIVMHELLHHFTNPRISACWSQLDSAAGVIYPHVKEEMLKLAYGDAKATIMEWFVNLFTIMYFQSHPTFIDSSVEHLIHGCQLQGFIWMERSVDFMKHFHLNRNLYVTVDDFMPQMVGFIKHTANNFDQVINEFNNRRPYVVETFPATGSIVNVYNDTIRVRFSEPMLGAYGFYHIKNENVSRLPLTDIEYWEDEYTFVLLLDANELEKGKTYGIMLNRYPFQSKKTYSMKEDYEYTFKIE